jgi:hypothetical protein
VAGCLALAGWSREGWRRGRRRASGAERFRKMCVARRPSASRCWTPAAGRCLPYDYVLGGFAQVRLPNEMGAVGRRQAATPVVARHGSRSSAMIRAAMASRSVRSGGVEPAKGSETEKPSSARRGITWTW